MTKPSAKFTTLGRRARGTGSVLLAFSGLTAAFGAALCCALPILPAATGLGTAWLGGIASFTAPHRNFLIAMAVISMTGAVVLLWRQRTKAYCTAGGACARPGVRSLTVTGVLLGLTLLYLGYSYG